MSLDTSIVGRTSAPMAFDYGFKDLVLYALGIGARIDELDYLYEGRGPKTFPSFAVIPTFGPMIALLTQTNGDLASVVHGAQKVQIHAPIPPEGKLVTTATIRGIYDMKKFASVVTDTSTVDAKSGSKLFDTTWTIIFRGAGGFGGKPPPREEPIAMPTDRPADFAIDEVTSKEQALLYRLSGDLNPLHADPDFAKMAGFNAGPILHGLCTFGHMVRAVVKGACGGDATRLKAFEAQFRKPVWPGDTITTKGFKLEGGRYALSVGVKARDELVITNASAEVAAVG
ncbi:MAG: 3-hydroxyacyl-thioester dehydratase HtdY [Polyangiales bacterium]